MTGREVFQPSGPPWKERAQLGDLRAVIDPNDTSGLKNQYIDAIHRQALKSHLRFSGDEVVLDFGCGIGRLSAWLAKKSRKVYGLDIDEDMLETARKINQLANVEYKHYNGMDIPFADEYFDLAVSVWVLQYPIRQREVFRSIVKEVCRVTKKGGKIALIEQGYMDEDNQVHNAQEYIDAFMNQGCLKAYCKPIRDGSTSLVAHLALKGLIPKRLFPFCLWWETLRLRDTRKQEAIIRQKSYIDYLFIFGK